MLNHPDYDASDPAKVHNLWPPLPGVWCCDRIFVQVYDRCGAYDWADERLSEHFQALMALDTNSADMRDRVFAVDGTGTKVSRRVQRMADARNAGYWVRLLYVRDFLRRRCVFLGCVQLIERGCVAQICTRFVGNGPPSQFRELLFWCALLAMRCTLTLVCLLAISRTSCGNVWSLKKRCVDTTTSLKRLFATSSRTSLRGAWHVGVAPQR